MATEQKQQTHTPGPWTWQHDGEVIDIVSEQQTVAMLDDNGCETEANAEFIVRACNCHEELLEACKELANNVSGWDESELRQTGGNTNTNCLLASFTKALAAIAKAEGK